MKAIQIIEATEKSKELGFYEGESYKFSSYYKAFINERGMPMILETILNTGATIKLIEL